jgi:hypothetical protein
MIGIGLSYGNIPRGRIELHEGKQEKFRMRERRWCVNCHGRRFSSQVEFI